VTIGEFWGHVTTLCNIYDGRVSGGPRSPHHNRILGGVANSFHLVGLAADLVLRDWHDIAALVTTADRLGIRVIDEVLEKGHLHLQPK